MYTRFWGTQIRKGKNCDRENIKEEKREKRRRRKRFKKKRPGAKEIQNKKEKRDGKKTQGLRLKKN